MTASSQELFVRKIGLVAYGAPKYVSTTSGANGVVQTTEVPNGIDLSEMRIRFRVSAPDAQTPKTAVITVFNLSDGSPDGNGQPTKNTVAQIQNEFSRVTLQAGYENGPFGVIFDGTIKQVRRGRIDAVDTFVEIFAADGDLGINFATVNASLAGSNTPRQRAQQLANAVQGYGTQFDVTQLPSTGGVLPRGKVLFGMFKDHMRGLALNNEVSWRIENGKVVLTPYTGYLPGQLVVLNSRTGLIGVPEGTQDGVHVTSLINPNIRVGGRLQIDNASINTTTVRQQGFPEYSSINFFADTSNDGTYRVLVIEHIGDTRGDEWYTEMTCLAVDPSAPAASSVQYDG